MQEELRGVGSWTESEACTSTEMINVPTEDVKISEKEAPVVVEEVTQKAAMRSDTGESSKMSYSMQRYLEEKPSEGGQPFKNS